METLGSIGELVSAIAVLVTLVYLSIQVRNTKAELRRGFLQNRDNSIRELLLEPARNPDVRRAMTKARAHTGDSMPFQEAFKTAGGLTDDEAATVLAVQLAWWFYRVETISNLSQLSSDARRDFDFNIRLQYGSGVGKAFWDAYKLTQGEDHPAVQYVEWLLSGDGSMK